MQTTSEISKWMNEWILITWLKRSNIINWKWFNLLLDTKKKSNAIGGERYLNKWQQINYLGKMINYSSVNEIINVENIFFYFLLFLLSLSRLKNSNYTWSEFKVVTLLKVRPSRVDQFLFRSSRFLLFSLSLHTTIYCSNDNNKTNSGTSLKASRKKKRDWKFLLRKVGPRVIKMYSFNMLEDLINGRLQLTPSQTVKKKWNSHHTGVCVCVFSNLWDKILNPNYYSIYFILEIALYIFLGGLTFAYWLAYFSKQRYAFIANHKKKSFSEWEMTDKKVRSVLQLVTTKQTFQLHLLQAPRGFFLSTFPKHHSH